MISIEKDNLIFIRLLPEENIIHEIKKACKKHNIVTGIVISAVGQFKSATLGYFKNKGDYTDQMFNRPLEILSITGNILYQENDYMLHLHTVLSDEKKQAIGGHLINGTISVTAEIVILKTSIKISRKYNDETGLMDLSFP